MILIEEYMMILIDEYDVKAVCKQLCQVLSPRDVLYNYSSLLHKEYWNNKYNNDCSCTDFIWEMCSFARALAPQKLANACVNGHMRYVLVNGTEFTLKQRNPLVLIRP